MSIKPIEIHGLLWEGSRGRDLQVGILEAAGSDSSRGGGQAEERRDHAGQMVTVRVKSQHRV